VATAAALGLTRCGAPAGQADLDAAAARADAPAPDATPPVGDAGATRLTVTVAANELALDSCQVTPAELLNVPAGTYQIQLVSSTLSKGDVATTPPVPSVDNYVLVHLPLPAGDPQQDHRFFLLNGIGARDSFDLPAVGTIQVMFIDSDQVGNSGSATVSLTPGAYTTTVDAVANVLRWQEGCGATPATTDVGAVAQTIALLSSTLSSGPGSEDDFVIVRLPSDVPQDDHRYVSLNGVGASYAFFPASSGTLRAWFISATRAGSGQAIVGLTTP
jgi:hypothetical protein